MRAYKKNKNLKHNDTISSALDFYTETIGYNEVFHVF